ncbi:MAG: GNAT family N-acetyltransferase [Silicimonas sp.]|nr:GNAT family N-acetyltransferase [Silicimonas sp.]
MKIKTLDTLEDVQKLDGLLGDYIRFVCDDLERAAGLTFDADVLLANTVRSLSKVIPPEGQTFVAETEDDDILGMVFLRPSGNHDMEIKRLYVVPEGRGTGAGRAPWSRPL